MNTEISLRMKLASSNLDPEPSPGISLAGVPEASEVEVLEVAGSGGDARRLAHLSIRVGAVLRVRRSAPLGGPILVESGGSTVAIGRSLARKVRVRVLS